MNSMLAVAFGAGTTIAATGVGVMMSVANRNDSEEAWLALWKRWFPRCVAGLTVATILAVTVPSQRTLYLIAGSEIGETAVTSEDGQAVISALRKKVMDYLEVDEGSK